MSKAKHKRVVMLKVEYDGTRAELENRIGYDCLIPFLFDNADEQTSATGGTLLKIERRRQ